MHRRGSGKAVGWTGQRYTGENRPHGGCPIEGLIGGCVSLLLSGSYTMLDFPAKPTERLTAELLNHLINRHNLPLNPLLLHIRLHSVPLNN